MLSSKLKKFAQENSLTVAHGVAYGYYRDYLMTLSESSEVKQAVFSVLIENDEAKSSLLAELNEKGFRGEHFIDKAYVTDHQVTIVFLRAYGIMKRLPTALETVAEKMSLAGVKGRGYCPYCGQTTNGTEEMYLINDVAMQLHSGCLESVEVGFSEKAEAAKTSGSVATGAVGAIIGAIIGAIPWAIVSYLGWFVGYLGFFISFASCKGYELLHGKETKLKGIIVLVVSLVAVVLAEYAASLVSLMREFPGTPLSTCFIALNEAILYDPEVQRILAYNLIMGWLFAALGMYSLIKQIFTNVKHTKGEIIKL